MHKICCKILLLYVLFNIIFNIYYLFDIFEYIYINMYVCMYVCIHFFLSLLGLESGTSITPFTPLILESSLKGFLAN